jgi:glycosyltransferase involved in cell wall biosynthesis
VLAWLKAFKSAVEWADVIHWHFGWGTAPCEVDLKYIASLKKACVVEFWGSDIRIPELASKDNPYFDRMLKEDENYKISHKLSRERQKRFMAHGFACLVPGPELLDYIQPDLFPSPYRGDVALITSEFTPAYPDPNRAKPVIVHTPSHKARKGTTAVLNTINYLSSRFDFEFKLMHNVSRDESLSMVRDCDIMLDQFVIGSYGTAALEAMAFGKPTVCYIKDSLLPRLPSDFPIINANQDNLASTVEKLIVDGWRRHEIGRQSRAYVEKHHDAYLAARRLVDIYQELLDQKTG